MRGTRWPLMERLNGGSTVNFLSDQWITCNSQNTHRPSEVHKSWGDSLNASLRKGFASPLIETRRFDRNVVVGPYHDYWPKQSCCGPDCHICIAH